MERFSNLYVLRRKNNNKLDWNSIIGRLLNLIPKVLTLVKWLSIEAAAVTIVKEVCDLIFKLNF